MKSVRFSNIGWALFFAACGGSASRAKPSSGADIAAKAHVSEPRVERMVISADRIAAIASGESDPHGAIAGELVLGRADADRRLFFHFPVTLPENGALKSASLLLTRSAAVDMTGAIELHAMRVIDPWDARSISWPLQPRIEEARAPHAIVTPAGAKIVRIDVAEIVKAWPAHDPSDRGLAVVADRSTASGASFA
ncbi:MAG: DNRLRE domain-containing protein, partial [Polyangiaceae bacterium]